LNTPSPSEIRNYTPGPWRANEGNEVIADRESHELLAMTPHNICVTCAGNARLMAAAPELYEALEAILEGRVISTQIIEKARTALKKVRGA
jgi:hypothetical protein